MKLTTFSLAVVVSLSVQAAVAEPIVEAQPAYQLPLAQHTLLTDLVKVSDQLYVAVGDRGHVLTSQTGTDWTQAVTPVQSLLTSVYFADQKHGWAVGHDASIIATDDGGHHWSLQQFKPETDKPLFDILFESPSHGIAVGAYGMFFRTTDAGKSWLAEFHEELVGDEDREFLQELKETDPEGYEAEKASILPHFNRLYMHQGTLYLVGEAGFFATSTDFGKSWVRQSEFYNGSLFGLTKSLKGSLIAVGLRGHAFRSTDEGQNWQAIALPSEATLNSAFSADDGSLYLTGNAGTLLKSIDDGLTFSKVATEDSKAILNALVIGQQLVQVTEAGVRFTPLKEDQAL